MSKNNNINDDEESEYDLLFSVFQVFNLEKMMMEYVEGLRAQERDYIVDGGEAFYPPELYDNVLKRLNETSNEE